MEKCLCFGIDVREVIGKDRAKSVFIRVNLGIVDIAVIPRGYEWVPEEAKTKTGFTIDQGFLTGSMAFERG